jgi:hypothetical protein
MARDVKVMIPDPHNAVKLLLRLGTTFDDIAALGFYASSRRLQVRRSKFGTSQRKSSENQSPRWFSDESETHEGLDEEVSATWRRK